MSSVKESFSQLHHSDPDTDIQTEEQKFAQLTGQMTKRLAPFVDDNGFASITVTGVIVDACYIDELDLGQDGVWYRIHNGARQRVSGTFEDVLRVFTKISDTQYLQMETDWKQQCIDTLFEKCTTEDEIRRQNLFLREVKIPSNRLAGMVRGKTVISEARFSVKKDELQSLWKKREEAFFVAEHDRLAAEFLQVLEVHLHELESETAHYDAADDIATLI
jgi:hypothetical protein